MDTETDAKKLPGDTNRKKREWQRDLITPRTKETNSDSTPARAARLTHCERGPHSECTRSVPTAVGGVEPALHGGMSRRAPLAACDVVTGVGGVRRAAAPGPPDGYMAQIKHSYLVTCFSINLVTINRPPPRSWLCSGTRWRLDRECAKWRRALRDQRASASVSGRASASACENASEPPAKPANRL